jgi:hypothetical protein
MKKKLLLVFHCMQIDIQLVNTFVSSFACMSSKVKEKRVNFSTRTRGRETSTRSIRVSRLRPAAGASLNNTEADDALGLAGITVLVICAGYQSRRFSQWKAGVICRTCK